MPIHPRQKMRRSNQKAIKYLLQNGFGAVWLSPHSRFGTISYFKDRKERGIDIFNIADGIAIKDGEVYLLQIKTDSWREYDLFKKFLEEHRLKGLFINVKPGNNIKTRS
jgi:hypothetical protein